jgi:muramoyltetrapeptide carboxypeptidase LdcA involved in peptidoglycan recycling
VTGGPRRPPRHGPPTSTKPSPTTTSEWCSPASAATTRTSCSPCHLKGSASWIDPAGAVLCFETSEEAPPPSDVDAYLTDLEQLGTFEAAAGLVFARPYGYTDEDTKLLWEIVARRTEAAGLRVLANVEAGHTDPMITLPIGAEAELGARARTFRLAETPTA